MCDPDAIDASTPSTLRETLYVHPRAIDATPTLSERPEIENETTHDLI